MSVRRSIHLFPPAPQRLAQDSKRLAKPSQRPELGGPALRGGEGEEGEWMDGQTDGRTDSPCILQDFVSSGTLQSRCPAPITATITKYQIRARVTMTISCLWAIGFEAD